MAVICNLILKLNLNCAPHLPQYYKCFSQMVEACCSVDIDASMHRKEWSVAVFQKTFALYHDQVWVWWYEHVICVNIYASQYFLHTIKTKLYYYTWKQDTGCVLKSLPLQQ